MEENLLTMEQTINNVPIDLKNRLEKVWDSAISGKGKATAKLYFSKPSEKLKKQINKLFKEKIDIENQIITFGHIRHINNRHGINGEIKSQIPVTKEIFSIIPDVLNNFNTVEKSNILSRGAYVIKLKKQYINGTIVIADAILQKNDLQKQNKADLEIRTVYII